MCECKCNSVNAYATCRNVNERSELERERERGVPVYRYSMFIPRWRYHYKLHGINIHLPIYSMSCGSNTMHVLLSLYPPVPHASFTCPKSKNRHYLWIRLPTHWTSLFRISFIRFRYSTLTICKQSLAKKKTHTQSPICYCERRPFISVTG